MDKLKELAELVPVLEKFVNLGLAVIIALGAVAGLVYIVWFVMAKLNQTIQANADAISGLKETLTLNTAEMLSTRNMVAETRDLLHTHHNSLGTHNTLATVMDERSKSVKEICCDTNNKVDELGRTVATAQHISSLQKEVADLGKNVAVACAKMEGV